jgi:GT2 family glycosyltransferase
VTRTTSPNVEPATRVTRAPDVTVRPATQVIGTPAPAADVTVVVLTRNRCRELLATLGRLASLPERPPVVVVDNGSSDGTAGAVRASYPEVELVEAGANLGAAGRTLGVARARTRYVAFCDDDAWWEPGSLGRGVDLLDAHPMLAAVNARVLVGGEARIDPTCELMARSPLAPRPGQPGPRLIGLLASATLIRRDLFLRLGGFHRCFGVGGEEQLLVLDLLASGRDVCYVPELVVHHHPSSEERDHRRRRRTVVRNRLWTVWLRFPRREVLRRTGRELLRVGALAGSVGGMLEAARGLRWVIRERRVVPPSVLEQVRLVEAGPAGL